MSDHTTNSVITATQKIAIAVTGGGLGLSMADITAVMQLISATAGAAGGLWFLWDRWQGKKKSRRTKS